MSGDDLQLAEWSLVPIILNILEKDFPDSLSPCRYLEFYESCKTSLNIILLTPGRKVDKYGTFVVYAHDHNYGTFYSLNPDHEEIKSLILTTKLIPWDKSPIWGPIHEKLQHIIEEIYDEKNLKVRFPTFVGHGYVMDLDEAKKITYTCPPEVYLNSVNEEQAEFIGSFWPRRGGNSVDITKFMISETGGIGLYLKESNELIAWCLIWMHKGPGQLFVTDQYKKKGYGMLVAKAITKLVADKGLQPAVHILDNNIASQQLFKKLGYQRTIGVRFSSAGSQE